MAHQKTLELGLVRANVMAAAHIDDLETKLCKHVFQSVRCKIPKMMARIVISADILAFDSKLLQAEFENGGA